MKKQLGTIGIHLMAAALLAYTASRTFDFLSATLPASQQVLAVAGLAAFDGGVVAWLLFYLFGAAGNWQRSIAAIMTAVSLAGVVLAFVADTLYRAGQNSITAQLTPEAAYTVVLAMASIIAANLVAVVAIHVAATEDPSRPPGAATDVDAMRVTPNVISPNGREPTATPDSIASPNASSGSRRKPGGPPQ